uniref:Uncharacterized protein n=1 Tax=Arundo donax TaxID=35708 RepID=A0A0A9BJL9_ARUDO
MLARTNRSLLFWTFWYLDP